MHTHINRSLAISLNVATFLSSQLQVGMIRKIKLLQELKSCISQLFSNSSCCFVRRRRLIRSRGSLIHCHILTGEIAFNWLIDLPHSHIKLWQPELWNIVILSQSGLQSCCSDDPVIEQYWALFYEYAWLLLTWKIQTSYTYIVGFSLFRVNNQWQQSIWKCYKMQFGVKFCSFNSKII